MALVENLYLMKLIDFSFKLAEDDVKKVITYGTFDMFHIGHLKLFQRLSKLGDELIISVSTDEFNLNKGKRALIPFTQRKEIVENIKCVNKVIPENSWDQKVDDIKKYSIDIFAIGDDWEGKFDYLKEYCEVIYLPRTRGISSTELRSKFGFLIRNFLVSLLKRVNIFLTIKK